MRNLLQETDATAGTNGIIVCREKVTSQARKSLLEASPVFFLLCCFK